MTSTRQTTNISELHRLTGLDRQTLGKMLKHLDPVEEGPKNARNYYLDECFIAIVGYVRARHDQGSKMRKEMAEAESAEITVANLRAELIPIEIVRSSAGALVTSLKARCIDEAPAILASKITSLTDRAEIEIEVRKHFSNIFNELRSNPNAFLKIPDVDTARYD